MKETKKKLSRIIDEILVFCYSVGATDISFNMKEKIDRYDIFIRSDFLPEQRRRIEKLEKNISADRQPSIEESYWMLTGESDLTDEIQFHLIGSMVDIAEVTIEENCFVLFLSRLHD